MLSIKKWSVLALTLAASSVFAAAVMPTYTTFGTLAAANFGGSGIPNDAVAITAIGNDVTLGLTATQRYSMPALTNDGAGNFHATGGAYAAGDNLAKWSFNFYIGGNGIANYTYKLFADYNPAFGDAENTYQDVSGYLGVSDSLLTAGTIQNSENLGFNTDVSQFNPDVPGQFGFILAAYDANLREVGRSAILVNVPEPASVALVGIALLGAVGISRRRRRG